MKLPLVSNYTRGTNSSCMYDFYPQMSFFLLLGSPPPSSQMEGIILSIDGSFWSKGTFVLSACSSVENVVFLNMFPATWFSNSSLQYFLEAILSVYTWTIKRKLTFVTTLFSCELPRNPYQHLDSKTMYNALRETYWRRPCPCNSFDYLNLVNLLVAAFDVEMFYYFSFALIKCVRNKSNWNWSLWHSYLFFRKTVQFQFCSVEISFFWIWTKRTCNIAWIHFVLTHLIILFMSKGWSLDVYYCASRGKSKFRYSNE